MSLYLTNSGASVVLANGGVPMSIGALSSTDLTLLGGFSMGTEGGLDAKFWTGNLASRVSPVDGRFKLLTTTKEGNLIEFEPVADGSLVSSGTFPVATSLRDFGNAFGGKKGGKAAQDGSSWVAVTTGGPIYWDATQSRLYWTYQYYYNNYTSADTCIGFSTLDDNNTTAAGVATYKLSETTGGYGNRWCWYLTPIPSSFASTYCDGKRLGITAQGGQSIASNGNPSNIALFAIDPPNTGVDVDKDFVTTQSGTTAVKRIIHWPMTASPQPTTVFPLWCNYGPTYNGDMKMGYSAYGIGYWVSGPMKSGLLYFHNVEGGNINTTVAASPSPTSTGCRLTTVGDLLVGDVVMIKTVLPYSGPYDWIPRKVLTISGSDITFAELKTENNTTTTPEVGGFIRCGTMYWGGGPCHGRRYDQLTIYSEANLASAVEGSDAGSQAVVPHEIVAWEWPHVTYPHPGRVTGETLKYVPVGMAFNATTKRLYVSTEQSYTYSIYNDTPIVWVFEVNC